MCERDGPSTIQQSICSVIRYRLRRLSATEKLLSCVVRALLSVVRFTMDD